MAGKSEERNEIVIEVNNTRKFFRLIEAIEFLEELAQMERVLAKKKQNALKLRGSSRGQPWKTTCNSARKEAAKR